MLNKEVKEEVKQLRKDVEELRIIILQLLEDKKPKTTYFK